MKIKINDFKGIYTNQDTAMLPMEYCADTDAKIERGWIEAKKYEVVSSTQSNDTILFQKEILLDEDKLKNKKDVSSSTGEYVTDYTYSVKRYLCTITASDVILYEKIEGQLDILSFTCPYEGTFVKAIESEGTLRIITQTKIYLLARFNRYILKGKQEPYLWNDINLIDLTKQDYKSNAKISVETDPKDLRISVEVEIISGSTDTSHQNEGILATTFKIQTKDTIPELVEEFIIVRFFRDHQVIKENEIGFVILPSYATLTTGTNTAWYEYFAKPFMDNYNNGGRALWDIPDEVTLAGLFYNLPDYIRDIMPKDVWYNTFNHCYSPSNNSTKNFLNDVPDRKPNFYINILGKMGATLTEAGFPYYYSCGNDITDTVSNYEYTVEETEPIMLTLEEYTVKNLDIPSDFWTLYSKDGWELYQIDSPSFQIDESKDPWQYYKTFRLHYRKWITPTSRTYSYDYVPDGFNDYIVNHLMNKSIYMYSYPSSYNRMAQTTDDTVVYFPKEYYLYEFVFTAVINNMFEIEIGKKSIAAPITDTNYIKITDIFTTEVSDYVVTKYRVYLNFNGKEKDNGRLLYEVDFVYGKMIYSIAEDGTIFKHLLYQDLTGVYALQTLNKPSNTTNLSLSIDDYFEFSGAPIILNRGILHYGTLGNGKYMPVFYDSNFVPGIQGRMFVYINGTLGIVDVDRIIMLSIVAQEGVLLFSKKDEVGFVVKDKYDIAETPDGVILHTRHGIFATNGQEMISLSEPINDIIKQRWENGNIFYDTYDKTLWYLADGFVYLYDFTYQTWKRINLIEEPGVKFTSFYTDQSNKKYLVADKTVVQVKEMESDCRIQYHKTHFNELGVKKKLLGIKFDLDGTLSWDGKIITTNDKREVKKLCSKIDDMVPKDFIELGFNLSANTKLYGFELTLDIEKDGDEYPV